MPRNGTGSYLLPTGNPVISGTTISSAQFNSTTSDIAAELTNSLPRDGQAPMSAPLRLPDGSATAPALAFNGEISTGLLRPTANTLALSVAGGERVRLTSTGAVLVNTTTDDAVNKLQVNGGATVSGALAVTGATSLSSINSTGNATVGGTLGVTGATTLSSVSTSGNATVGGTLAVTGATTLTSVNSTGNATVGGTLAVTGATTLAALTTTGNTVLGDAATDTLNVAAGGLVRLASGNVGIGTANPIGNLHVAGETQGALVLQNKAVAANFGSWREYTDSVGAFNIGTINDTYTAGQNGYAMTRNGGTLSISSHLWSINGTEVASLNGAGYFGIGGNAGYQLQVRGIGQIAAGPTDAGAKGASIYLIDTGTTTAGHGGAVLFGGFGSSTPFAAVKGFITDASPNTRGNIVFSTRRNVSDTSLTTALTISGTDGNLFDKEGLEIGFKDIPQTTSYDGNIRGKCVVITASITVTGFIANTVYSFYNNSASPVTLGQAGGFTLRLAGTTLTGNRTLAPRGFATLWYITSAEAIITGAGVS